MSLRFSSLTAAAALVATVLASPVQAQVPAQSPSRVPQQWQLSQHSVATFTAGTVNTFTSYVVPIVAAETPWTSSYPGLNPSSPMTYGALYPGSEGQQISLGPVSAYATTFVATAGVTFLSQLAVNQIPEANKGDRAYTAGTFAWMNATIANVTGEATMSTLMFVGSPILAAGGVALIQFGSDTINADYPLEQYPLENPALQSLLAGTVTSGTLFTLAGPAGWTFTGLATTAPAALTVAGATLVAAAFPSILHGLIEFANQAGNVIDTATQLTFPGLSSGNTQPGSHPSSSQGIKFPKTVKFPTIILLMNVKPPQQTTNASPTCGAPANSTANSSPLWCTYANGAQDPGNQGTCGATPAPGSDASFMQQMPGNLYCPIQMCVSQYLGGEAIRPNYPGGTCPSGTVPTALCAQLFPQTPGSEGKNPTPVAGCTAGTSPTASAATSTPDVSSNYLASPTLSPSPPAQQASFSPTLFPSTISLRPARTYGEHPAAVSGLGHICNPSASTARPMSKNICNPNAGKSGSGTSSGNVKTASRTPSGQSSGSSSSSRGHGFAGSHATSRSMSGRSFRTASSGFHGGGFHGGRRRSDVRLKVDIVPLGRLANGIGLYRFRYRGDDHTLYVGVMAQEVQNVMPRAVSRDSDGYLRVNYTALGLPFLTWDRWLATTGSRSEPAGP